MNVFSGKREIVEPIVMRDRLAAASLAVGSIIGLSLPLFLINQSKLVKAAFYLLGCTSALSCVVMNHQREQNEKLYRSIVLSQKDVLKASLQHELVQGKIAQEISGKLEAVELIEPLPDAPRAYFAKRFGLSQIMRKFDKDMAEVQSGSSYEIAAPEEFIFDEDEYSEIDYNWLDADFINSSKLVFAPKGSGKSVYLAYESVKWMQNNPPPENKLFICDPHFDEDQSEWYPGMEPAQKKELVKKKAEDIKKVFYFVGKLLRTRIDKGVRDTHSECYKVKIILDEGESFFRKLTDDELKGITDIIAEIEDEGRKYGITTTVVFHSLKKQNTNVDSGVFMQMNLLALGRALADPATKWPADFNVKQLLSQQTALQATLKEKQGRTCVVRKLDSEPQVKVIPHIDLNLFTVS